MANVVRPVTVFGFAGLVLLSVLAFPNTFTAQQTPAPPAPWMQLTFINVSPAMVDEYLAVQREILARLRGGGRGGGGRGGGFAPGGGGGGGRGGGAPDAADGAALSGYRIVSRSDVFGDSYRFVVITPVQTLASLDARNADPELAALNGRAQKYVTGQQSYAIRSIPEFSNPLPDRQAPTMIMVNVARVVPGREQDYLTLMKSDFFPHFDKANFNYQTGLLTFGGEAGFIHLYYIQNLAKLDEGSPVVRALGVEAAQSITSKFAGIVTSNEHWVARVLPDLSYGPWSAPQTRP